MIRRFVAPPLNWVLCLVLLGGAAMAEGPFLVSDFPFLFGQPSSSVTVGQALLAVGRALAGFYGGIVVAKLMGRAMLSWREHRRWRRCGDTALRSANRVPALSVTMADGELVVRDVIREHRVSAEHGLTLQRYDVPHAGRRRAGQGLLVRDPRKVALDVPAEFDAAEVEAFAVRIGADVWRTEDDVRQLPRRPKRNRHGVWPGRLWWRVVGRYLWALMFLAPVFAVMAAAHALGLRFLPEWVAWELGGLALLVVGGWLLVWLQAPQWVRWPERQPDLVAG